MDQLLTKRQLAEYLQLSVTTIERQVRNGHLPYRLIGTRTVRFDRGEVDRAMSRGATEPIQRVTRSRKSSTARDYFPEHQA